MRKTLIAILLAVPLTALANNPQTVVLDVRNMTCSLCSITIQKALQKVPGVTDARIDYSKKIATVKFDRDKTNAAALVKATTDAGFPSSPHGEPKP